MGSIESDIVLKAEAILAAAKSFKGDRTERYALMKKVDQLYLELEDPMDAMLRQWTFVRQISSCQTVFRVGTERLIESYG
jgi:hypothetical protein